MKKILLIVLVALAFIGFTKVDAKEIKKVNEEKALKEIIKLFNEEDEEFYERIDPSLEDNFDEYFGNTKIKITKIKSSERVGANKYKIKVSFDAESNKNNSSWSVSGFTCYFTIKYDSELESYVIVDTDIFNLIGTENVTKFVTRILAIVFIVLGIIFGGIGFIAIIIGIVLIIVNSSKKKNKTVLNE